MNELTDNLKSIWNELGTNQKISILATVLLVAAALLFVLTWANKPQMRLLYGGVSEKDAAEIVGYLQEQGIDYEMRAGGSAIFVPERSVYRARMDVASRGLVRGDEVGFEIFDESSFGVSDFLQRTNFVRAVQGELARTIMQLNGVRSARVMVVIPENRFLRTSADVETTASVFVDVGGGRLEQNAVRSIRSLVANAVEGLRPDNVSVVDNNGNVLSTDEDSDSITGLSGGWIDYRRKLEDYFGEKVETMLERVVGRGNVVVRVSAEVDPDQVTRMEERFDNEGVLRSSTETDESTLTEGDNGPGGVASMEVGANANQANGGRSQSETLSNRSERQYEIGRTLVNTTTGPGAIARLSASVFVAARTDGEGEDAAVINRTAEEIENLRLMISNALGIPLEEEDMRRVSVQEAVFRESDTGRPAEEPAFSAGLTDWLHAGQNLISVGVAILLFLLFLHMLRKAGAERRSRTSLPSEGMDGRGRERSGQPVVTPDMLNDLIRKKPENVATSLGRWVDGGGQS